MVRVLAAACLVGFLAANVADTLRAAPPQRATGKSTTFQDDVGEEPRGPDIRAVVVSSTDDDALTIRIGIPSHPVLTEDMRVRIWLDSDDDRTTGLAVDGLQGLDHFLLVDRWELGLGAAGLFRCSGSTCSGPGSGSRTSLRFSYESGATFTLQATELGLRHSSASGSRSQ